MKKVHCSDWLRADTPAQRDTLCGRIDSSPPRLRVATRADQVTCAPCLRTMERMTAAKREAQPRHQGIYESLGFCGELTTGRHPEVSSGREMRSVACTHPPRHDGGHSWERSHEDA